MEKTIQRVLLERQVCTDSYKQTNLLALLPGGAMAMYSPDEEAVLSCRLVRDQSGQASDAGFVGATLQKNGVIIGNVRTFLGMDSRGEILAVVEPGFVRVVSTGTPEKAGGPAIFETGLQQEPCAVKLFGNGEKRSLAVAGLMSGQVLIWDDVSAEAKAARRLKIQQQLIGIEILQDAVCCVGRESLYFVAQNVKEVQLSFQTKIRACCVCEFEGKQVLAAAMDSRQVILVDGVGRAAKTFQVVSKYPVVFVQPLSGTRARLQLLSEANELIILDLMRQEKAQKVQTITQVKQDFYNSVFKADSRWLGAVPGAGLSEGCFFAWE